MNIFNLIYCLFNKRRPLSDAKDQEVYDMHSRVCFKYKQTEDKNVKINNIVDRFYCHLKFFFFADFAFW